MIMLYHINCTLNYNVIIKCMFVTLSDAEGHGDDSVGAGDSVQTADEVRQVVQHTQVVLHHNDVSAIKHTHIYDAGERR